MLNKALNKHRSDNNVQKLRNMREKEDGPRVQGLHLLVHEVKRRRKKHFYNKA